MAAGTDAVPGQEAARPGRLARRAIEVYHVYQVYLQRLAKVARLRWSPPFALKADRSETCQLLFRANSCFSREPLLAPFALWAPFVCDGEAPPSFPAS